MQLPIKRFQIKKKQIDVGKRSKKTARFILTLFKRYRTTVIVNLSIEMDFEMGKKDIE